MALTLLTVAWLVLAISGLVVNLWELRESYGDRHALRATGKNGMAQVIVGATLNTGRAFVVTQAAFVVIGLPALLPVDFRIEHRLVLRVVSITAFFVGEGALVYGALVNVRARRRLRDGK